MPNLPISQLPELTAVTSNAEYAVSQNGTTYRVKAGYISSGNIYGSFYSTNDQSIVLNTPIAMSADTQDLSNGIVVIDGSKFTVSSGGTFNIQFSAQVVQGSNSALMAIWFRKNGTDIAESATQLDLQNNTSYVFALNFLTELNANEYIELWWASNSSNTKLEHFPALTTPSDPYDRPSIPSLIVTVTQV